MGRRAISLLGVLSCFWSLRCFLLRSWKPIRPTTSPQRSSLSAGPGGVLPDGRLRDAFPMESSIEAREGILRLFPSPIYRKRLRSDAEELRALNEEIVSNFKRLMVRDEKGIEWSETHYAGGYTSYFSLPALQKWVPPIQTLEEWLKPHILEFRKDTSLKALLFYNCFLSQVLILLQAFFVLSFFLWLCSMVSKEAGLQEPELFMTDCWANVMGRGTEHSFHQHNRSTISGTYYVQTPKKSSSLLFEDPRLDRPWSIVFLKV